jgi:hypothetical protein
MNLTLLGCVIVPVTFVFFFMKKSDYLLIFAIFSSIFQAASVINFQLNGFVFGVSPYYFIGIAILVRNLFDILFNKKFRFARDFSLNFYSLLSLLVIISVFSSFLLPSIFNGIEVYNPRLGIDSQLEKRANLNWSPSNLAQCIYIFLNSVLFFKISQMKNINRNFIILEFAAALFILVAFMQIFLGFYGINFPYQIFNSNPGYAQLYNQEIFGFVRVSGTFTEPSTAAAYMSAILALFVAYSFKNKISLVRKILYSFVFLSVLLTTSTVAIICIAVIIAFYCFYYIKRFYTTRKIIPTSLIFFLFAVSTGLIVVFLSPVLIKIINFALLEKSNTHSFAVRSASDLFSLELLVKTVGLGVGLGSNRPSSFFTYVLSNLGLLGFSIFSYLISVTLQANRFTTKKTHPFIFAFLIYLIAKIIAVPDLSDSGFWMIWALAFSTIEFRKPDHIRPVQGVTL